MSRPSVDHAVSTRVSHIELPHQERLVMSAEPGEDRPRNRLLPILPTAVGPLGDSIPRGGLRLRFSQHPPALAQPPRSHVIRHARW